MIIFSHRNGIHKHSTRNFLLNTMKKLGFRKLWVNQNTEFKKLKKSNWFQNILDIPINKVFFHWIPRKKSEDN